MNNIEVVYEFIQSSCPEYNEILHDRGIVPALRYVFNVAVDCGRYELLPAIGVLISTELGIE